ncbi:MAG: hypothetical protein IJ594_05405 [Oscillospiraceae bacterium]|nr:hypothetical protein [Oscillospiraceae bacterium]
MAEISYSGGRLPDLDGAPQRTERPPQHRARGERGDRLAETLKKNVLDKIRFKRVLGYALFLFLALLAQNMLFTQLRIAGICPMILPAVAVAAGMFEGASWGAVISLVLGIFADMAFVENTVLFTIVFPALAFGSGFISQFFINRRFFAYMGAAFLGLALTGLAQMLRTAAVDSFSFTMLSTVALQTLWSLPFAPLAYLPAAHWID